MTSCALVVATALTSCSPFGADPSPVDAGPVDAGPGDGSLVPEDASAAPACGDGGTPLFKFSEPLADAKLVLQTTLVSPATVAIVPSALGRALLRAEATPPAGTGDGVRAYAEWSFQSGGARTVTVDYDFRASYEGAKVFAQGGCRVTLAGGGKKASTGLDFLLGKLFIGGKEIESGVSTSYRGTTALSETAFGPPDAPLRHATFALTLGAETVTVSASIERGLPVGETFKAPFTVDEVDVACGVIYSDNSDAKKLVLEVANLDVVACK